MLLACSHLVIASDDVDRIAGFFAAAFDIAPSFANDMFAEFVLPSKFRVAFFKPVGASGGTFQAGDDRSTVAFGMTVADVQRLYERLAANADTLGVGLSGPPKAHAWGETSFLLTVPDGNRWEVTQSPSLNGMLTTR